MASSYKPRLAEAYLASSAKLQKELGLSNPHQLPKLEKIILNVGLGRAKDDKRLLETALNTLAKITGQKPVITKAKVPIASFRLRAGQPIGAMISLRGQPMYEFLDRLISLVIPRLRDFHGLSLEAFDQSGNYNLGLKDQAVFSELSYEETTPSHGLQISLVINSQDPSHSRALLRALGWPLRKETN